MEDETFLIFKGPRNFDLDSSDFKNGWPAGRQEDWRTRWLHNDVREMSYLYIYKAIDQFVQTGDLQ